MRSTDWSPLAASDPIPGDPARVGELADHLADVAASVRARAATLASIDTGSVWDSPAAAVLIELQSALLPDLDAIATRYDTVSSALRDFKTELEAAQGELDLALGRAREAQADLEAATAGVARMEEWEDEARAMAAVHNAAHPGAPTDPEPWWGDDHRAAQADAEARLASARADAHAAGARRDHTALEAVWRVKAANDDELRNASGIVKVLGAASEGLGYAGAMLGVASIVLPVLVPVSYGLGAASLAVDAGLAAAGERGWDTVGLGALTVATGGLGRAFDAGVGAGAATARGLSAARLRQGFGFHTIGPEVRAGLDDIAARGVRAHASSGVDDLAALTAGRRYGRTGAVVTAADVALTTVQAGAAARRTPGYVRRGAALVDRVHDRAWSGVRPGLRPTG